MKYNFALIPNTKSDEVIMFANKFSNISDKYLLGQCSLPHVTLYQFEIDECKVDYLWKLACKTLEEKTMNLEFDKFSCLTFDNKVYWVSLLPNDCEELHKMHAIIAEIINKPINKKFDPHMTLINTKNKDYEREVERLLSSYTQIADQFTLSLGKSDDIGQLTEIIHRHEIKNNITFRRI